MKVWNKATWLVLVGLTLLFGMTVSASAETCIASVYWQGSKLATGERFYPDRPLVAHKHHRLRSYVLVTNLENGRSKVFQVLDRGPYIRGRCIDLSRGAASILGVRGLARVTVEPVSSP